MPPRNIIESSNQLLQTFLPKKRRGEKRIKGTKITAKGVQGKGLIYQVKEQRCFGLFGRQKRGRTSGKNTQDKGVILAGNAKNQVQAGNRPPVFPKKGGGGGEVFSGSSMDNWNESQSYTNRKKKEEQC